MVENWRLCYVSATEVGVLCYFCPPEAFGEALGDDWDDAPFYCNATPPTGCYTLFVTGFSRVDWHMSVLEINRSGLSWIVHDDDVLSVAAGTALDEFIRLVDDLPGVQIYYPAQKRRKR